MGSEVKYKRTQRKLIKWIITANSYWLTAISIFFTFNSFAQINKDKLVSHNGKKYYLHIVTKGETLYGLSKDYNIEVSDIVLENPGAIDGISPGDTIRLPEAGNTVMKKSGQGSGGGDSSLYIFYKVEPKATMYSLCRQYGVSTAEIDSLNPSLADKGMRAGMILRIPRHTPTATGKRQGTANAGTQGGRRDTAREARAYKNLLEQKQDNSTMEGANRNQGNTAMNHDTATPKTTGKLLDKYNIALLLPFMNEDVDSLSLNKLVTGAQQFPLLSQISCDFYEGAKMALDSAAIQGLKINLYVYNIPSDSAGGKIDSILKKPVFRTMNLIVGPPSPSHFRQVAAFALKNNIPVVSPLSPESDVIRNNSFVSKAVPSPSTEMEQMCDYIVSHYQSSSIIIVHNPDASNNNNFETVKKRLTTALSINEPRTDSLYVVNYTDDLNELGKKIDDNKFNLIIAPYQDASFVTKFLNQLANSKYARNDSIAVFGMNNWASMDVLDVNNLDTLHLHYPAYEYTDYANRTNIRLLQKFRNQFYSEPGSYALQGFDVMYYYLTMLKKYGTALQENLPANPYRGVHTAFDFYKPNPSGGFENKAIYMLEYRNYTLVKDL